MKNRKRNVGKYTSLFLAATVTTVQLAGAWPVYAADSQEYAGTTQIGTNDIYSSVDTSAVDLVVEEVYAEEGSQLSEGDAILKLTDDSYQEALAYYEAAIIKADSTLTDTQLEYDQGVLEAKYTCESAQADAENAEYIRSYQTNEVETALSDHEEALEDIDDRIAELEEGIADGSYDTSSASSSSGTAGSGSSSAGGSGNKMSGNADGQETETESESESESESEAVSETESEPGSSQPETEPGTGETDSSDSGDSESGEKTTEELRQELTSKMSEAEELAQKLTEKLKEILENTDNGDLDDDSYSVYTEQLKNIISQLEADVKGQEQVKNVLSAYDFSEKDSSSEALTESIEGDKRVLDSLKEIQEKMTKYQTLISSVMNLWGSDQNSFLMEKETLTQMSDYLSKQAEINELSMTLLEKYESEIKELEEKVSGSSQDNNSGTENGKPSMDGNGDSNGQQNGTGNTQAGGAVSGEMGGASGSAGGAMSGGMSGTSDSAGSMAGAASGTETQQGSGESMSTAAGGQNSLSGEDISLLGDTYDLSNVEQLLSREPSDSDDAQDLIDELEDSKETVETQYEELQRKEKIFALEIQHTYDTAVIDGKLAELTYQQQIAEWDETLAEAKQEKADLETQKALLEDMTDGVISASQAGTVASVSYDAEDVLSSSTPVISLYDTDTVSITLEIDQEDIAGLAVGDTAEVTLAGAGRLEGTLTEKSIEPESGTSRTSVKYTATVSVDNSDGRLSDGLSATVTFADSEEQNVENDTEKETEADVEKETDTAAKAETESDEEAVVNE